MHASKQPDNKPYMLPCDDEPEPETETEHLERRRRLLGDENNIDEDGAVATAGGYDRSTNRTQHDPQTSTTTRSFVVTKMATEMTRAEEWSLEEVAIDSIDEVNSSDSGGGDSSTTILATSDGVQEKKRSWRRKSFSRSRPKAKHIEEVELHNPQLMLQQGQRQLQALSVETGLATGSEAETKIEPQPGCTQTQERAYEKDTASSSKKTQQHSGHRHGALVVDSGFSTLQGKRPTNEDCHIEKLHPKLLGESKWIQNYRKQQQQQQQQQQRPHSELHNDPLDLPHSFFGIYDGHGGRICALYCSQNIHINLLNTDQFIDNPKTALHSAIVRTDENFVRAACALGLTASSGSCVLIAYIVGSRLLVANVGDSRAVIYSEGKTINLSRDQKPGVPEEKKRIEALGGMVAVSEQALRAKSSCFSAFCCWRSTEVQSNLPMRLYPGGISVSRAMGDIDLKLRKILIAEPEIVEHELDPQKDAFLILACDGVWDVITSEQAGEIVHQALQKGYSPKEAADILTHNAFARGSNDNISAFVITFSQDEESKQK